MNCIVFGLIVSLFWCVFTFVPLALVPGTSKRRLSKLVCVQLSHMDWQEGERWYMVIAKRRRHG